MKKHIIIFSLLVLSIGSNNFANAQEAQKIKGIYVTTGAGINKIQGTLKNTFRSTIAFNSGLEKTFNNWFVLLELGFNTQRYDQQTRDEHSAYLFHNTTSSLITLSANGGYNFQFGSSRWFASPIAGVGYINVGKPRLSLDETTRVITQSVIRKQGILGKAGGRVGYNTKTKLLHTIYLESSYWTTSIKVEDLNIRGLSAFIGIRMTM